MTYSWWRRIVTAAGLFHSDPRLEGLMVEPVTPLLVLGGLLAGAGTWQGSSRLVAPRIHAFQVAGLRPKSLLYAGFLRAVGVTWTEKELFSDRSIPLKIAL
jgi:hypothetical protein